MWSKVITAVIILLVTCRISLAQGIHLEVDDTYEPHIPVDYPFIFPLTGLTVRELWVMSCATSTSCDANGVRVCGEEETNFGVTSHVGCPRHHTGEDWLVRTENNEPSTALAAEKLVRSINHGVVVYAGLHAHGTGYVVIVKHKSPSGESFVIPAYPYEHNGTACGREVESQASVVYSYYLHLDEVLAVRAGDQVIKGQVLGQTYGIKDVDSRYTCAGTRGGGGPRVYCPHLHLELWSQIRIEDEYLFDPNGYDDPGCGEGQFGYRLSKLVEPTAFLKRNNEGPFIGTIDGHQGELTLYGEGLGENPGVITVRGYSSREYVPDSTDWNDTSITVSGAFDSSSTLEVQVRRSNAVQSNVKGFPFIDASPQDWYSPSLMNGWGAGLLTGRDQDVCSRLESGGCSFAPAQLVKRSELIPAVIRAIEMSSPISERGEVPGGPNSAPAWLYPYLEKAYGYTNPLNGHEPVGIWAGSQVTADFWAQPVTRQEAAHVIMNALRLAPGSSSGQSFSDVSSSIAGWVYACRDAGIFEGDRHGNTFRPSDPMNRAELAKVLDMAFLRVRTR